MWKVAVVVCVLISISDAKPNGRPNMIERLNAMFEYIQSGANETLYNMYLEHMAKHKQATDAWEHEKRTNRAINTFSCDAGYVKHTDVPTSVHRLRPEHISVVAAMGDSLTAGNGILGTNILHCLTEYRGRAWSIGGDNSFSTVRTLPNILKKYSPMLKGYSLGSCDTSNKGCSQLNVAVAGETSQELPAQATELVSRLHDPNFGINVADEWKLITVFIGGNDLCDYCKSAAHSPSNYINKITEALDILKANVPRAFVNLVQIFDITPLAAVSQGIMCKLVVGNVCECPSNTNNAAALTSAAQQYQRNIEDLVAADTYTTDDFVVVLQPFFKHTEPVMDRPGHYDLSYFAPDCFHFSEKGTYAAAKSLWNNMFESVGGKSSEWFVNDAYECSQKNATDTGYLKTPRN